LNTDTATTTQDDRFMIFMLSYVDTIGCETIKRIYNRLDRLSDILNLTDGELKNELGMRDVQIEGFNNIKRKHAHIAREYEALLRSSIHFCTFKDDSYPRRLLKIKQNPAVIYSYGNLPGDMTPAVGIVGSRACTSYGSSVAGYFAEVLADNGINVISGMAVGIDAAAHRGALKSRNGRTYAVLAGGVNVIYPRDYKYIYDDIIMNRRGGIISEMLPGKAALSRNFPMRNRIISGLSDLVLIVEAREKSGSLITIDYAKSQNIPVMAIPGRITDPMSKGTNRLISSGCAIANDPEDVLKNLKIMNVCLNPKNKEKLKLLDNAEKIVYSTLVSDPKHTEIILHETGLPRDKLLEALISLELQGLISQVSSNYYVCN